MPAVLLVSLLAALPALALSKAGLEYAKVFDDTRVHSVHLILEGTDYEKLDQKPFQWMNGDVEIDGERVQHVGIRKKGNSSAGIRTEKKPFKIRFDKYLKDRRFHDLKQLAGKSNGRTLKDGAGGGLPLGPGLPGRDPVKDFDRDGDGAVSREEWTGPPREFDRLDRNGDGKIEASELRK